MAGRIWHIRKKNVPAEYVVLAGIFACKNLCMGGSSVILVSVLIRAAV